MAVTREGVVGWGTFAALLAAALALGIASGDATLLAFLFLVGLGAGGAMAVFAALFAHIVGRPMRYEPVPGEAGAWGLLELEKEPGLMKK